MYKIDLTHPDYFHQMKKVELLDKTETPEMVEVVKSKTNSKYKLALKVVLFLMLYFSAIFGIVNYFSN